MCFSIFQQELFPFQFSMCIIVRPTKDVFAMIVITKLDKSDFEIEISPKDFIYLIP